MKKSLIVAILALVLVSSCANDTETQEKVTLDPNAKRVFSPENITPPTKETLEKRVPLSENTSNQANTSTEGMVSTDSGASGKTPEVITSEINIEPKNTPVTNPEVVTITQSGVVTENRVEEIPTAPSGTLQMNGLPPTDGN